MNALKSGIFLRGKRIDLIDNAIRECEAKKRC